MDRGTRFGSYEVAALIGVGGMGEVYRATDPSLKREVALKVLSESFIHDKDRLARLQREAELLAALNHPNVAHIYGIERAAGGAQMALVMELIEGPTLEQRLADRALPPDEALSTALQIVAALEAAHERGIVHRDLKPANIKIKPDGTVKVLDFGIAKALDTRAVSGPQAAALTTPAMTEAGSVLGTAAYMSPEQARGKPVDRRADVWAFGCVLYEMLTGQAAFLGDDVTATLARVLEREPDMRKLPSGLPSAVRGTLELCLQKDPKRRLRDIGDVRLALEGRLAGAAEHRSLWRRALPLTAAVAAGALLAAALVALLGGKREPAAVQQQAALPVTRFIVQPDPSAPLANLGGYDVMISPDGKRLAYFGQNRETSNVSLFVREIDGLEAKPVPGTDVGNVIGAAGNMNPFFSADGRSMGFLSPTRGGVIRVALEGGGPIKIFDEPAPAFLGAAWAADDTIVYSGGFGIYRTSAGGGAAPELLTENRGAFLASPVLLPGRRAVMYGVITQGVERVAVFDIATREEKIIVENGQNAFYSDTGHIVFARGTTIMAAPFDVAELAVTGAPVAVLENVRHPDSQSATDFALSPSGTLVYVPGGEDAARARVVWVDRNGKVAGPAIEAPLANPRDLALSPDGTRLALTVGALADGDLWVYDLRGRPPIRVAVTDDDRLPVWSPDSKQLAFTVTSGATRPYIHTVLADGSMLTPRPIRSQQVLGGPRAWTAAGELIIMQPPLQTANILAMPVAGEELPHDVVATEYQEIDAALSADGRWLAYSSNRTGRDEIWVQRYPEGVAVRVSTDGGFEPRWSADGNELFYLLRNSMMAVSVRPDGDELDFSPPRELFAGPYSLYSNAAVGSYDVARDGRFVMLEQPGAERMAPAGIVVVQNWTEELKRRVPGK
ncbi:MAG TPA: protein kinase [Gammaproteobacteria bacterium]|nr:protein kinase [Gammaproteobacteria bacterium]